MFVKPMPQPFLHSGWQLQQQLHKTQGLEDFKIAPCVHDNMRALGAELLEGDRLACLVGKAYRFLGVGKQMIETVAQHHSQHIYTGNCRVAAWLQFGRVPHVAEGRIVNLRYENPLAQNFTPMALDVGARRCPSYLTNWEPPRQDILAQPDHRR